MDKRRETIAAMFNEIAFKYDFLNHFLSLGIDKLWRRRVVKMVKKSNPKSILDIAAGTGDLSLSLAKKIEAATVIGADISQGMLNIAIEKCKKCNLDSRVSFEVGDALDLRFSTESFDALTVAFGVRNFENLEKGLSEMLRVTKKDGLVVVLELSMPQNSVVRWGYNLYFTKILPIIGRMTSKSDFAYNYLPMSVGSFVSGEKFLDVMSSVGYKNIGKRGLCLGIATIYYGYK